MAESKVRTSELLAGSNDVTKLRDRSAKVGSEAVDVLAGMAGRVGHLAVASALSRAASQGATTYVAVAEVYQRISQNLSSSGDTQETTVPDVIREASEQVPAVSLAVPDGDADELHDYATRLEMAAASASGLGADTSETISAIQQKAAWTGPDATASLALSDDLGAGVAETAAALVTIATAVRTYARALGNAQALVGVYNRSAAKAELAGGRDPEADAVMQAAARDAQVAMSALESADGQAAAQIASATAQLGGAFTAGKPVRMYLASLPSQANANAVPTSTQMAGAATTQTLVPELPVPATVDLLIGDGLPLATPKPLILPRHVDGPLSCEGPLALDYRTFVDRNGHLVRPGTTSI
jgi:hypothetical protein